MLITYEPQPHLKLSIDNFYWSFLLETGYDSYLECCFYKIIQFSYFSRTVLLMNRITYPWPTNYLSCQESYLHVYKLKYWFSFEGGGWFRLLSIINKYWLSIITRNLKAVTRWIAIAYSSWQNVFDCGFEFCLTAKTLRNLEIRSVTLRN